VYFKPRAIPLSELEELVLTIDELEALRLADLEGLYQEAAAEKMQVSRQTFGNIIKAARKKVADALVSGKAIRIEGGVCSVDKANMIVCEHCAHTWEGGPGDGPWTCPLCQSPAQGACRKNRTAKQTA
jgi:predicted DNA-binding protein (UPF0251 family)